ncbi:RluA family pseudouridine synthase [Brevibacillus fulvus]|nr:RluA family pseudouridine synthase [Brevibacillus fulvus]
MIKMEKKGEWLVGNLGDAEAGMPAGQLLREQWKLPKKLVHLLFQHKDILLDGLSVGQHVITAAGQEIRLRVCQPEELGLAPVTHPLTILYEDDHLLVADKPAGILLHPTEPGHQETLDHWVAGHFQRTGIQAKVRHIHRLDQDTSGAVLYAKHALAAALLDERLRLRQIKRNYIAFVHGQLKQKQGTIDQPIGRDRHHPQRRRVSPHGETAITHFLVRQSWRDAALLECRLDTGRTHQIRVHLSYLGHPLIGDVLYGGRAEFGLKRQALHAERLRFLHPFGEQEIEVYADWPPELLELQQRLS